MSTFLDFLHSTFHLVITNQPHHDLQEQNVGMNWTYTLERLAAPLDDVGGNAHVVQVVSRPRHPDEFINLHFFTNLLAYSTEVYVIFVLKPEPYNYSWYNYFKNGSTPPLFCLFSALSNIQYIFNKKSM